MTVEDPDVSSYQGFVDWVAEVSSGVLVGAAKASEGPSFNGKGWKDPTFVHNWLAMKAAGIKVRIAYHFCHPGNPIAAELQNLYDALAVAGGLGPFDLIAFDTEVNPGPGVPAWVFSLSTAAEAKFGISPLRILQYSGEWFISESGGPAAWKVLTRYPMWVAYYGPSLPASAFAPWSKVVLWQNTDSSRQPGVHGVCDGSLIQDGGYFTVPYPAPIAGGGIVNKLSAVSGLVLPTMLCPTGGYAEIGPDGGVFNFGSPYFGSLPEKAIKPNAPIIAGLYTPTGMGYWLCGADGGIFDFGDATPQARAVDGVFSYSGFKGQPSWQSLPIVGIVPNPRIRGGYTQLRSDGSQYDFPR